MNKKDKDTRITEMQNYGGEGGGSQFKSKLNLHQDMSTHQTDSITK